MGKRETPSSGRDWLIPLEECRRILGDRAAGWSDAELERHVEQLEAVVVWAADEFERRQRRRVREGAPPEPLPDLRRSA